MKSKLTGKYFEELNIGDEMVSLGRTVTETDIVNFACLSGDFNPAHVDDEFAKTVPQGKRFAHGLLGLSILSGLICRLGFWEGTAFAFLHLDWDFVGGIFPGDTIYLKLKIADKRSTKKPDRGLIIMDLQLLNQRDEVVQKGQWTVLLKTKKYGG